MSLTKERLTYKPFAYPWAFEAWKTQQQIHWLPEEIPLGEDVKDWDRNLTPSEKHLVTQIFRFFTQADVEVNNCYHKHYMRIFKPTEVIMMLTAFANMETIHIAAYSYLLDTIGMPEGEYAAFLSYKEMRDKHDFMQSFEVEDPFSTALTMAAFGAFTEGLSLFASFAILLNFPRFNKMKGMGKVVTWSVRDETLHCENIIKLYHTWLEEHPQIDRNILHKEIINIGLKTIEHEDAFIDLAFSMGPVEGLTADEVKSYIRFIGNMRFNQLGIKYSIPNAPTKNPLKWLDVMLNSHEHTNFFEARATEYTRASTTGQFDDVWQEIDNV